jgi:sorting nexin-29
VRTLNEPARVGLLARELQKVGVNVAAIQEIRWPRTGEREFRAVDPIANTSFKYHIYYSGGDRAERGVGFIVFGSQMKRVIRWKPISDRICVLRMKGKFFNYSLISIYAPTNDKPDDMKDEFYESLDKAYGECPKQDVKIVIGDANAQIGRESFFRPVIGTESLHSVTNDNGLRLVTFAAARGMAISSTYFARKNIRKHTWQHPSGDTCSQIDHVLVDGRHFSDVIDVRSFRGPNIDSDHYLVVAKIRARLSSVTNSRINRTMRFNIQRLSAEGVAAEYCQKLDERIGETNGAGNINSLWEAIHETVTTTAQEVIGSAQRRQRRGWFDEDCQRVTDEKNAARSRMLVSGTRLNRERYRAARVIEKRIHRRKKRQHEESVIAEAQERMDQNDMRRFYATVNGARHKTAPVPAMCNDREGNLLTDRAMVAARWKQHFEDLLNGSNEGVSRNRIEIDDDGKAVEPPTLDEVKKALSELKNSKAAGKDEIPVELLKHGSEQLHQSIHRVLLRIWQDEEVPTSWLDGLICPIYKKGHRLECANYRGITLLNSAYKILSRILFNRLRPLEESFVGEYQAGFREGRSTTDQMFSLRMILDKFREYNLQTHHLFIDFKAAYDSVKRNELWQIMLEHGFPAKLIRLIRATLDGSKSSVRIADEVSTSFVTLDGLKQGDALSNLLFNIALEGAIRRSGVQRNGTIITRSHMLLGFADDIDIIGIDRRAVEEAFVPLKKETARIGLTINSTKTKYMVAGRDKGRSSGFGAEVVIDGDVFEVVEEFVYLGTLVTCDNDVSREVKRRIAAANRAFYGLRNQLRSRNLQTSTKFALYKTLILPVALYGHEAWTLKEVDRKAFGVFERKVLRTILGGKLENGVWRRRMNHELYQVYRGVNIIKRIKHGRLQWAGHLVRMPEERIAKIVFTREPGRGRRLRGRPRTRWLHAVEEDLAALNVRGNWRSIAQDRRRWSSTIRPALA